MSQHAEQLWVRILAHLRQQGRLPLRSEELTPLEIADLCNDGESDRRVHRFVHDYYYPHRFGQTSGGLSDANAEALVEELEAGAPSGEPVPPISSESARCHVCDRRVVSGKPA